MPRLQARISALGRIKQDDRKSDPELLRIIKESIELLKMIYDWGGGVSGEDFVDLAENADNQQHSF
ncbi:MAG: hypothetical protein HQK54_01800 [Oligoflexales bacterium]|nr:hypothetical protein [Oligoflexales bacterium]